MPDHQVFAKPAGAQCNLACDYCYYLENLELYPQTRVPRMSEALLERYTRQLIAATKSKTIEFFWHGGEPLLMGREFYEQALFLQEKWRPANKQIVNSLQTNGTLIDDEWAEFLVRNGFRVGLSLDGPADLHDPYRQSGRHPGHQQAEEGFRRLASRGQTPDVLCVVHETNVRHPLRVYDYFKSLNARYIGFLPLVVESSEGPASVDALAFGEFLVEIFDRWLARDVGTVMVQLFEEVARVALTQPHSLCIFRKTCGDVPVLEHNGNVYSCDHYVDAAHCLGNIQDFSLGKLLQHSRQKEFGREKLTGLADCCKTCEVLELCNGGCPKDRIIDLPDQPRLNHLCVGYQRFFRHTASFREQLARQSNIRNAVTGRNDDCPCGSGKKYKHCCLNRPDQ